MDGALDRLTACVTQRREFDLPIGDNCDGTVDVVDLGLWAGGIHLECGQSACP